VQVPLSGTRPCVRADRAQAEQELNKVLSKYIRDPQVVVSVAEERSQPVSILGAVNTPGVHQVRDTRHARDASASRRMRPDRYSIRITRQFEWGCIPLPESGA